MKSDVSGTYDSQSFDSPNMVILLHCTSVHKIRCDSCETWEESTLFIPCIIIYIL